MLLADPFAQVQIEHERAMLPADHPQYQELGQSTGWAIHFRRTYKMLEQTLIRAKRMFPKMDPGVKFHAADLIFEFSSGYRYQFAHCHKPDDWEGYQSNQYTHIAFDELVQFTETQYEQIRTRVRSSDSVLRQMLKVRSMSNPMMRREANEDYIQHDPHWVRRRFVDPEPRGRVTIKRLLKRADGTVAGVHRLIYLPATLYDNPDPDFVADYERRLLSQKPHIRNALLYGDWYIIAGAFHSDTWNPQVHVCPAFNVPPDWAVFRSMDWGYKKPGAVLWWAISPDGDLFCIRERTFQGMTATAVARLIRDTERDLGYWSTDHGDSGHSLITGPADTQLWERRGDETEGKDEEMAALGVNWVKADKRSRKRNAEHLEARLKAHENGTMQPGITFFSSCRRIITTLPGIQTSILDPECPADGGEDHWYDCTLYACAYASRHRSATHQRDEDDDDDDQKADVKRGQYGYGQEIC